MAGFTQKQDSELQTERKVQKALRTLGYSGSERRFRLDLTAERVLDRYRSLVKEMHPDSADKMGLVDGCHGTIEECRQAKDYLVKHLESKND